MDLFTKKNTRIIILLILFTLIVGAILSNVTAVLQAVKWVFSLILPFLVGGAIAFILNIPTTLIEEHLLNKIRIRGKGLGGAKRIIAIVLAVILVVLLLGIVLFLIVPELARTLVTISYSIPGFINWLEGILGNFLATYPDITSYVDNLNIDWDGMMDTVVAFLQNGVLSFVQSTISAASSFVGGVFTAFIALFFAIYILTQKERLGGQMRKVIYAYLPEEKGDEFFRISTLTSRTFSNFVTGQGTEILILMALFFVSMLLLGLPYPLMIAVLIGFFAIIPIFGTFLGCALGALLILVVNPTQALIFIVLFIVVQQIEGNFIYPYVVGNSVGLPSIWVLVAVSVGGSAMGVLGMIIMIPVFSVLYTLFREKVLARLGTKEISAHKLAPAPSIITAKSKEGESLWQKIQARFKGNKDNQTKK